jgi:addiction module RelB/DinJ family antitoxin
VYTIGHMNKTVLNVKTDKKVKDEARRVAAELGIPLSTVVNAYLKEFIREKAVHLSIAPSMSPRLEKLLAGVEKDIKEGKNLSPVFSSAEKAIDYLENLE